MIRMLFSDNVLDDDMHTEVMLRLHGGKVQDMIVIRPGAYLVDDLIGSTVQDISDMVNQDSTGNHPETYVQVFDGKRYRGFLTVEQIKAIDSE